MTAVPDPDEPVLARRPLTPDERAALNTKLRQAAEPNGPPPNRRVRRVHRATAAPNPNVLLFFNTYADHYYQVFGKWYETPRKDDTRIIRVMLESLDIHVLRAAADIYLTKFSRDDHWPIRNYGHTIRHFKSVLPAIMESWSELLDTYTTRYREGRVPIRHAQKGATQE